jgi:hypothetical protein
VARRSQQLPGVREAAVLFLFPDSSEIKYLSRPPAPGARVRSSAGRVWTVASVLKTGEHTFTAQCFAEQAHVPTRVVARPEDVAAANGVTRQKKTAPRRQVVQDGPGAFEDLATHLLKLTRRAIGTPSRLRRRYKMRHYIP